MKITINWRSARLVLLAMLFYPAILAGRFLGSLTEELKLNPAAWGHRTDRAAISDCMRHSYENLRGRGALWCGVPIMQYPADLLAYHDLIIETRPDFVIETGTAYGGLTLWLSSMIRSAALPTRIITVDIDRRWWDETLAKSTYDRELLARIEFIEGSSVDPDVIGRIASRVGNGSAVVILDSLHEATHVRRELEAYSRFVPKGGYIMVNDTTIGGWFLQGTRLHRIGPLYGVRAFARGQTDFVLADSIIGFPESCMYGGILRRVAEKAPR